MKISYFFLSFALILALLSGGFYFALFMHKPKVSVKLDTAVTQLRDISPISQTQSNNIKVPDIKNTTISPDKKEEKPTENTSPNTVEPTQNLFKRGEYESQKDLYRI